ncbi:MAG: universal stress protein [Proteobacteria bacterium]|nr:MAG: universal stress protein [Pseudomonadota bacterium]
MTLTGIKRGRPRWVIVAVGRTDFKGGIMIQTILVAIDGSAHSKRALEFACDMAAKFDASLHLIHVAEQPMTDHVLSLGAASVMASGTRADLTRAGRKVIEAATDVANRKGCKTISSEVTSGDATRAIVDSAKEIEAGMIVMGTRGLGSLSGMLLGSVSHKVLHLAPCTCVTVT